MTMRKSFFSVLSALLFSATFCFAPTLAQTGKGTITGTAKDSAGAALSSTLIELQPVGRKVVSDDQGQFRITEVPAGEYTLMASYVGLNPFSLTVKVEAGQTVNVDPV